MDEVKLAFGVYPKSNKDTEHVGKVVGMWSSTGKLSMSILEELDQRPGN